MRLLILSNRLQVTVTEKNNILDIKPSSGGLITGLSSYLSTLNGKNYLWIGWPGNSSYSDLAKVKQILLEEYNSYPIFIEEKMMDSFYNGFCNKTLWPLFHYFPFLTTFDESMWDTYRAVNALFAEETLKIVQPDDILWIHDYHFMLIPQLIKEKKSDISIGFFLHIPFPYYEIFRLLPRNWGKSILNGILHADLVGFHTHDYSQYFLKCVLRILGINHNWGILHLENKITKVRTFPMGIDYEKYSRAVNQKNIIKEKTIIKQKLNNLKVILSVDRQDYTKGILKRLEGYDQFLQQNPKWHQKVVLLMVVVPSRIGVDDYQKAKSSINQLIGNINGTYGDIHWTPVIYQYRAIPFNQLIALYNVSDVGLVTPLRDGMNLVAKEFIAAQKGKKGVLILSEMAGAAMELGEALIINPNNPDEIAESIKIALEMPMDERSKRISFMQERLKKNDVIKWASDFLDELENSIQEQDDFGTLYLNNNLLNELISKYQSASKKILFLDYDGTLISFNNIPSNSIPYRKLLKILDRLAKMPNLEVVIISGRKKNDLEKWFGKSNLILIAEHGAWLKIPNSEWRTTKQLETDWKPKVKQILKQYQDRLPYSFIEEKDYSIVWHYRNSDSSTSELRVREFVDDMVSYTAQNDIEVLMGNKIVEIKCSMINKGEAAKILLLTNEYRFILAAGDDYTDESLFKVLPEGSFSIKIGSQESLLQILLNSSSELVELLGILSNYKKDFFRIIFDFFKK